MLGQKEICENLKISEAKYWQIADNWKHYSWAIGDGSNQKAQTVIMCDYTYQDEKEKSRINYFIWVFSYYLFSDRFY